MASAMDPAPTKAILAWDNSRGHRTFLLDNIERLFAYLSASIDAVFR